MGVRVLTIASERTNLCSMTNGRRGSISSARTTVRDWWPGDGLRCVPTNKCFAFNIASNVILAFWANNNRGWQGQGGSASQSWSGQRKLTQWFHAAAVLRLALDGKLFQLGRCRRWCSGSRGVAVHLPACWQWSTTLQFAPAGVDGPQTPAARKIALGRGTLHLCGLEK